MYKLIFALCLLTGCMPSCQNGEGAIIGRLIDVRWGGVVWESCEVHIQYGENASKVGHASSVDKQLCDRLSGLIGKHIKIKYNSHMHPGVKTGSQDLILSAEEVK